MVLRLFLAIFAGAALTTLAQAQQPRPPVPKGPKPTVADVQKVVGIITADKAKLQIYCDVGKVQDQMDQAAQKKDKNALQDLGKKLFELEQKLGPEYADLMQRLAPIDPNSKDGKALGAAFDPLDKQCTP